MALLASSLIAARSLHDHVADVASAFEGAGIDAARCTLSRIVGRETAELDEAAIARAAIESLAENTSDGVAGFSSSDHNQRPAAETADNRQSCPVLGLLRMSPDQRDRLPQLVCPPPLPDNSGPLAPRLSQSATEREQTLDDRTRPDHG